MIYKPKGSRYYFTKFHCKGQVIRKSTRATNSKLARSVEGKIRGELAQGNWGILEKKPAPTLSEFLCKDFEPFTKTRFAATPKSLDYYLAGANMLKESDLKNQPIDQIPDQHAGQFAA